MAKRKRELAGLPNTVSEQVGQFVEDFQTETDRGAALTAAEFLSHALESAILAAFIDRPKGALGEIFEDLVIRPNAPLGTFSAKCKLAYCMGLIPESIYADLNLVREIRNEFAHSFAPVSFDDQRVNSFCRSFKTNRILAPTGLLDSYSPRDMFITAASLLCHQVLILGLQAKHPPSPRGWIS